MTKYLFYAKMTISKAYFLERFSQICLLFQRTQSIEPSYVISCLKENPTNCIKVFITQQTGNFYSEESYNYM